MHKKFQNFTSKLTSKYTAQNNYNNKRCSSANGSNTSSVGAVTSLISLFVVFSIGVIGLGQNVSATTHTASISTSGTMAVNVMPNNGDTGTNISADSINVTSTCKAGYNLSLSSTVSDNNLYLNGSSSNNTTGTYFTPADGTTSLSGSTNAWGYYYNSSNPTTSPTSNNTFSPVPTISSTAATIKTSSETSSTTDINDTFNVYYGVSVSNFMPIGTYKMIPDTNNSNTDGAIVYYLTMDLNCTTYQIAFNPNTGTGTMENQRITEGVSTNLTTNTFTPPTGKIFTGWNTAADGSGASYQDGQSVTDIATVGTTLTLYAQWGSTMQSMAFSECSTTGTTVYDSRDNQKYTVAKLADGNCWMLDNLALDLTDSTVLSTLTTSNTNIDTTNTPNALDYLRNGGGTSSDRYAMSKVANWTSASYSYSDPWIAVNSATSGKCNSASRCVGNSALTWNSTDNTSLANGGTDAYPGKVGVYYNYCAASAGTYCYGNGADNYGNPSGDSVSDICPKGWRMPTSGSSGEYQALYAAYNSKYTSFRDALQVPLSGYFRDGKAYEQGGGGVGHFWSSTYNNSRGMYTLYAYEAGVEPSYTPYRRTGYSVRCMKEGPVTFNKAFAAAGKTQTGGYYTMQDANTSICSAVDVGEIGQLIDTRDNTVYNVAKLADNKCWMLDNLAIDLTSVTLANLQGKTNASNTTLGYLKNGGGSTSDKYATAGVSNWTSSYSYSAPLISAGGSGNLGTWTKDTVLDKRYGAGSGKAGVYYNYCAASAGSYCYGNGTSAGTSTGNATEDICPSSVTNSTGWHMPSGGSSGDFNTLYGKYNTTQVATNTASLQYNLSTPLSGYFRNGSAGGQGSYGYWWSSTRFDNDYMYGPYVNASSVRATLSYSRYYGNSMRCVLGS